METKLFDVVDIACPSRRRQIADRHVLDHSTVQFKRIFGTHRVSIRGIDSMIEDIASFELSLPGPSDPIRFFFTRGGSRDHIASFVRTHGLSSYEAPTPAIFAGLIREV